MSYNVRLLVRVICECGAWSDKASTEFECPGKESGVDLPEHWEWYRGDIYSYSKAAPQCPDCVEKRVKIEQELAEKNAERERKKAERKAKKKS